MYGHWFAIFVLLVAIIILIVSILNVIYYNRIRSGACNALTRQEAETGFWTNIIVAILVFILLFITVIFLFSEIYQKGTIETQPSYTEVSTKTITPIPSGPANGSSVSSTTSSTSFGSGSSSVPDFEI